MLFVFFSTKSGTNFETRALAISVGETTPYLSLTSAKEKVGMEKLFL